MSGPQTTSHRTLPRLAGARPDQRLVCTYHKSGTTLFESIMRRVAAKLGLRSATRYGLVGALDPRADILILAHSLIGFEFPPWLRGVRIIRDPRDIWVSGYLYHRRCPEGWCVNTNLDPTAPITYPRVDFSMQHRPERWKQAYLERLAGKSYQQNLLDRDQAAGLAFELDGYTGTTMEALRAWPRPPGILDVKLETIAAEFDASMWRIFRHMGFDAAQCEIAVGCAVAEDVARMDDATLAKRPHIHGRQLSKWRDILTAAQIATFERRHRDLILALGYEPLT